MNQYGGAQPGDLKGITVTVGTVAVSGPLTQGDGVADAVLLGSGSYVLNGAGTPTWDRQRAANAADATAGLGLLGVGGLAYDTVSAQWKRLYNAKSLIGGQGQVNALAVGLGLADTGTTTAYIARNAPAAANTTGNNLLGVSGLQFDGTNYQTPPSMSGASGATQTKTPTTAISIASDNGGITARQWASAGMGDGLNPGSFGVPLVDIGLYNTSTVDRLRDAAGVNAAGSTIGVLAAGLIVRNSQSGNPIWPLTPAGDTITTGTVLGTHSVYYDSVGSNLVRARGNGTTFAAYVQQVPSTLLGVSNLRLTSASTATGVVKGSAGSVHGWYVMNTTGATEYLHLYNKATAPTLSTDTPVLTLALPSGAAANLDLVDGDAFSTGISYAMTTDNPAIPATAGSTGDIQGTIFYV